MGQRTANSHANTKLVSSYGADGSHHGTQRGFKEIVSVAKPMVVEKVTQVRVGDRARKVYSYSVTSDGHTQQFPTRAAAEQAVERIYAKAKAKAPHQ